MTKRLIQRHLMWMRKFFLGTEGLHLPHAGSVGSILSIGSVGSVLSVGSFGSAGSILALLGALSFGGFLSVGQRRAPFGLGRLCRKRRAS